MENKEQGPPLERVVAHLQEAQRVAREELGVDNLFLPGRPKEMIMAGLLGHEVIPAKHGADARDGEGRVYEYLSCLEKGSFQLDRMFKAPREKRERSLLRVRRNEAFYCAVFSGESPLEVMEMYRVATEVVLAEAERQLRRSANEISHVGLEIPWVRRVGTKVELGLGEINF